MKWQAKALSSLKQPNGILLCYLHLHLSHISLVAKSWSNSPASCVAIYSQLAACPVEMELFEDHPSTRGRLTGLRNKPQQK